MLSAQWLWTDTISVCKEKYCSNYAKNTRKYKELSHISILIPNSFYGMYKVKVRPCLLRWLVGNIILQRPRPDHRSVNMGFCGGQSGTGTGLSPSTLVSTCHYVSPKLHTHHNLNDILITSCKWNLGTLMATDFWMSGSAGQRSIITYSILRAHIY